MRMRLVGAALAAALAGCGGGRDADADAEPEAGGGAVEPREELPSSRFEVSVDTQRVATPDSEVAPSENPDD